MAVTSNLTNIDGMEATTGWTAITPAVIAIDDGTNGISPRVGTYSLQWDCDIETSGAYFTIGSPINGHNHFWVWFLSTTSTTLATQSAGGIRIRVGSGTGAYREWYVGGSDTYKGGWTRLVVYTDDTTSSFYNTEVGTPNWSSISYFAVVTSNTAKSKARYNMAIDNLDYGTGITVDAGTVGTPLTWADVASGDETANAGVVSQEAGAYTVQGPINFGDAAGTSDLYFNDSNQIVIFKNAPVSSTHYTMTVAGNSTGTCSFVNGTTTGTGSNTLGVQGITYKSNGPPFILTATGQYVDILKLYGCNFLEGGGAMNIGTTTTAVGSSGDTLELRDNTFSAINQVVRNIGVTTPVQNGNKILGATNTTASFRAIDGGTINASEWTILNSDGFDSVDDAATETITVEDHNFAGLDRWVYVRDDKTWNLVNPAGGPITEGDQTDITFEVNDLNSVNEKYSLDAKVAQPDGTAITTGAVYLYEGLRLDDLVQELYADGSGLVSGSWTYKTFTDNGGTSLTSVTDGNHALKAYAHGKNPFVAAITSNAKVDQTITLTTNSAISETVAATAISAGAGITLTRHATGETDTRAMKALAYDGGTGLFVAGETVSGASASGTVLEVIGDATSGLLVIESWNGTEFVDNESLSGSASGAAVADNATFYEEYTWEIDCNALSLQTVYDYLSAKMAQNPLDAIIEQAIEWGIDENGFIMESTGSSYYTLNTSNSEGVWLTNRGTGTVDYMTADDGTLYYPPTSYSFTLTGLKANTEIRIYNSSTGEAVAGIENSGTSFTYNYTYSGDINIYVVILHIDYKYQRLSGLTLSNGNQSIPIQYETDRVYRNP